MLNIYRASAGAGKTHHLTGVFIELLFGIHSKAEHSDKETLFNEILAVTFTNKSTAEMKGRVVDELYKLSKEPTKSDYYQTLRQLDNGKVRSDEEISRKAKSCLSAILNNYSEFAISTIDSFFQKILRSFARELNLQSNYEVEINANRILDGAISNFLEKLDRAKANKSFEWMLKFSTKRIEEGNGWRLEKDLIKLAKSALSSEEYRKRSAAFAKIAENKDALTKYIDRIAGLKKDYESKIVAIGEEGQRILSNAGMAASDFSGGTKSVFNVFERWKKLENLDLSDTFYKWAESSDKWYTAKHTGQRLDANSTEEMLNLMQKMKSEVENDLLTNYYTSKLILDNMFQIGILADLDNEVKQFCNDESAVLLSNTTDLLNKLITTDDAPFIYEKTGTRIHHFMIDEFQDTSHMQWNNFKPLIENSLADGKTNLIVGDVKQSIYRWRGSDWELLNSGLKNFAPAQSHEDSQTLKTNYRSQREIIKFNNEFFKFASHELAETFKNPKIETIFGDVEQAIPKNKLSDSPGAVDVHFIDSDKETKFVDLAMEQIPKCIMQLEDAGFEAKDIAILCRKKEICKKVAATLLKYKSDNPDSAYVFDIISNEALLVGSRQIIKTIISILQFIQYPDSATLKVIAQCNILALEKQSMQEALKSCFGGNNTIDKFLEFGNRPLYDMVEGIISQLPSVEKEIAFVQAFRDCVLEFANSKKADIAAFLQYWEQNGDELFINTPEGQNAIRILTIHKSKGLGMPAVILPCCEGTVDMTTKGNDVIWCEPKEGIFFQEELTIPLTCAKALSDTIFAQDYENERLKAIIDNLNTIYVAYTRAKEAMVLIAPKPSDKALKDNSPCQEVLLYNFVKSNTTSNDDAVLFGEFGRKNKHDDNANTKVQTLVQDGKECTIQRKLSRLALQHNKVVEEIDAIGKGNCIHDALSAIKDYDNIDQPIDRMYISGALRPDYFTCEEMKAELHRILGNKEVRQWFSPGLKVLNEKTILAPASHNVAKHKTQYRPDRVVIDGKKAIVIDYKTGEHMKSHYRQVSEYMNFLKSMGCQEVEGYLWYIYPHRIVKVTDKGKK